LTVFHFKINPDGRPFMEQCVCYIGRDHEILTSKRHEFKRTNKQYKEALGTTEGHFKSMSNRDDNFREEIAIQQEISVLGLKSFFDASRKLTPLEKIKVPKQVKPNE